MHIHVRAQTLSLHATPCAGLGLCCTQKQDLGLPQHLGTPGARQGWTPRLMAAQRTADLEDCGLSPGEKRMGQKEGKAVMLCPVGTKGAGLIVPIVLVS